jgi:hypothetical protein
VLVNFWLDSFYPWTPLTVAYLQDMVVHHVVVVSRVSAAPMARRCSAGHGDTIVDFAGTEEIRPCFFHLSSSLGRFGIKPFRCAADDLLR